MYAVLVCIGISVNNNVQFGAINTEEANWTVTRLPFL